MTIKLPFSKLISHVEAQPRPATQKRSRDADSFPIHTESISTSRTSFTALDRGQTLTNIMTVSRNPSTIFKPPFGTSAEEHHVRLGEHTEHLWKYNKITDLTVKLLGVEYPCHKTVLSCYSKYFTELLLNEKNTTSVINLRIPSITNTAFEVLLTYMYTSELNLTCQNIGEVYTAARKLGIDGALILCTRILIGKNKHGVHSVYVYVTAKKQRLNDCAAKALKIMTRRFEQIVGTPEFLDLDFSQVQEYLSQDVLATRSEVVVFLAAMKWLSVKFLEREPYATDLLSCVRFQMMTLNEVLACFSPPLLPGILQLKKISDSLLAATCYVAATTVNEEKRFEHFCCRPRKYLLPREPVILWDTSIFDPDRHAMYVEEIAATKIQAAFRGYKARKSIESDKAAGILRPAEVKQLDEFEPPKDDDDETYLGSGSRFSVLESIRKSIVSFIGISDEEIDKSEENQFKEPGKDQDIGKEDLTNLVSQRPRLQSLRRSSSMDTLVSHVNSQAENVEIKRYSSETGVDMSSEAFMNSFTPQKPEIVHKVHTRPSDDDKVEKDLNQSSSSSASDENPVSDKNAKGYILVTGGFKSDAKEDDLEGKKMFLYDSSKNKWKSYGSMERACHHHCVVYLNEEIYFIGGCNPAKSKGGRMVPEKTCYKLHVESGNWEKISKMNHCRMYHGVVELDGKIYAIGGKDNKDRLLDSVEMYIPASNKWEKLSIPLEKPTMGLGACAHQGKLWIVGGIVQDDEGIISVLTDVRCYNPEENKWSRKIKQIPSPRAFSTIVSFENNVYVIGGTSQSNGSQEEELTSVSDVLFYESREKGWVATVNLPFPRHFVQAIVLGSDLYVLGGLTSYQGTAADEVLIYDKKNRKWRSRAPLPESLCGFAAITLP